MTSNEQIGRRVLDSLGGATQTALAEQVGMTQDAMSRAIRGQRGFASIELAEIAAALNVDVYWLITGQADPMQVQIAARHDYDRETGEHSNPGRSTDQEDLGAVELAYRQVYPRPQANESALPSTPEAMREVLGDDFVRFFADGVEQCLNVEVVRIPSLSTAYSLTIGGRRVIMLPASGSWWRSNSDLAHELGHLALGHHDAGSGDPSNEPPANRFASELLLPEDLLRRQQWESMTGDDAAKFVWDVGVSGAFLTNRLSSLRLTVSDQAWSVLSGRMPGLLRRYTQVLGEPLVEQRGVFSVPVNPIDERMQEAKQRRFPASLVEAHLEALEAGRVNPATLAWMRGYDADLLDDPGEPRTRSEDFSDFGL